MAKESNQMKKLCPICGKVFETSSGVKKYCSPGCRTEHDKRRAAEWYRNNRRATHSSIGSKAVCEFCGEEYMKTKKNQYYCCTECMKRATASQRKQAEKKPPEVVKRNSNGVTDWVKIVRICEKNKLSYGQAVRKGLLDG